MPSGKWVGEEAKENRDKLEGKVTAAARERESEAAGTGQGREVRFGCGRRVNGGGDQAGTEN